MSPRYVENYRRPWQRDLHHLGGTAVRGLARKGPRLPFADRAIFWISANDNEGSVNSLGEAPTSPNRGSLGGVVVPANGNGPAVVILGNGKRGWNMSTNGGLQFASNTALQTLHDPTSNALVSIRIRVDDPSVGCRLLMTRNSTGGTLIGFSLEITGSDVRITMADGTATTLALAGGVDLVPGWYTIQVRKTALLFESVLNGAAYLSGSASNLVAGAQNTNVQIGSSLSDSAKLAGVYCEVAVHSGTFSDSEVAAVRHYLESEWTESFSHPKYHTCQCHFQADHPSTIVSYSTSPATVSTAPNVGSLGGILTAGTGSGPELVAVNGRLAARSTSTGSLIFGTTSTFQNLHDPATYATLSFAVNVEVALPSANKRLVSTKGSAATARGVILYHTSAGTLQFVVSDGTSNVLSISGSVLTTGVHSIIITKSLLAFAVYVDGVLYASGSASALAAGAQDSVFALGSTSADTTNFDGAVFEALVLSVALTAAEVSQEHFAILRSTLNVDTLTGVVTDHDADFGITLATGISSWVDRRNGVAATQGTPGAQPTFVQNWRFGRAAMLGGAGKLLVTGAIALGQPSTWIIVGSFAATNTTLMFDGVSGSNRQGFARNASGLPTMTHGTAAGTAGTAIAAGTPFVAILEFGAADSDSVMTIHAHGYVPINMVVDPDGAAQSLTGLSIGGTYVNSNHWDGHIAKLVPVNRLLTSEEKAASLVQLKTRYGVLAA